MTACDWSTALVELGPPASKRSSHNLPALSPAAPLPAALLPALLPALTAVVDAMQGWLLLGLADAAQWQQARVAAQARFVKGPGVAGAAAASVGSSGGFWAGEEAGEGSPAVLELLASWGIVQAPPGSNAATIAAASGAAASGAGGAVMAEQGQAALLQPSPRVLLGSASSLLGVPPGVQRQHRSNSSSTPQCLLLSGHGAVGQSELAAATLKLLDSRAGEGFGCGCVLACVPCCVGTEQLSALFVVPASSWSQHTGCASQIASCCPLSFTHSLSANTRALSPNSVWAVQLPHMCWVSPASGLSPPLLLHTHTFTGAAVYTLSLPVMLLLGEGAAGAGLVAGVQEALGRSSSTQPLVIFLPRLEVS